MNSGSLLHPVAAGCIGNNCMASSFTNHNPFIHSGQGLEETRHLLMCATLELNSARAVASAEVELHDAQVRHLQELLAAAQRERDEAREQYLGLQGCLSHSPSMNAGRGTAGSTILGRHSHDHQSQQQQLPNSGLSGVMSPAASTVQQEVVQQQQQFDMEELQKHLEILQDDEQHLEIFQDEHLVDHLEDLADLDSMLQQIPQEQTDHPNALQNRSTHEQYFHHEPCAVEDSGSDELLSHCIRQEQQMQVQLQSADQQVMRSSLMEQQQQQVQHQQGDMSVQLQQSPWRQSLSSGPSPAAGFSPAAAAVLCSSAVVSPQLLPSCLPAPPGALFQTAAGSPVSSLLGTGSTGLAVSMQQQQQRSGAPASVQQLLPCKHVLPEPPEADLQLMLSSLPEKGKLMQAVMDAGPLLQTLLMASSSPQLPQWRHPPPGLESLQLPITNSSCATDPNMSTTTLQGGNKYGVHRQLQRLSSFSSSYPISNNSISNNNSSSSSVMSSPSAAAAAVSGLMSSNVNRHLRRVNSMGHLMSPEMALTNQPRKYTKIY